MGAVSTKHRRAPSNHSEERSFRRAISEDESDNGSPAHLKNFRSSHGKAENGAGRGGVRHRRLTSEDNFAPVGEIDGEGGAAHISPPKHHASKGTALKKLNKR
jgi:hypothetical protein